VVSNHDDDDDDDEDDNNVRADLHNAVPVVASSNAKQCQKRHAEVSEVGVVTQSFARMSVRALCTNAPHTKLHETLIDKSTASDDHNEYKHSLTLLLDKMMSVEISGRVELH